MSIMSEESYNKIDQKPKIIMCNRSVSSVGGDDPQPVGECFIQVRIDKKIFRD